MSVNKYVFGALVFLLLVGSVSAGFFGAQTDMESQVVVVPDETGLLLNISVLTFEPAVSTGGTNIRDVMQQIVTDCQAEGGDLQACINRESIARTASSTGYQMNLTSLQNARVTVEIYNPMTQGYTQVTNCGDLTTNIHGLASIPAESGQTETVDNWYAQCDLSEAVEGQTRSSFRVMYLPADSTNISMSFTQYEYDNAQVSVSSAFTASLNSAINGLAQSETLPCVGVFLILGLLLSSLYFSGKSPISLLDITTPRLPAPKGVTAGGQMLMPFGYTEMKRTTKAKMAAAAGALAVSAGAIANSRRGDSVLNRLNGRVAGLNGTAADRAAGDVAEGRRIASSLITAGRTAGMSEQELERLAARLPYHYGDEEHRTIAQLLERLQGMGGRERLMALTLKDYMLGLRQYQSLEVLTAHPDIGKRSAVHQRMSNVLTKTVGVNRYAIIGGFVPGTLDSTVRTGRVVGRMGKGMVTHAPELAKATARTTMSMLGGRKIAEERGRSGSAVAWVNQQASKNPASLIIGQAFPVSDKMGHLYNQLNKEAHNDSMRYVLKQLYKKMGMKFNVSSEELATMGHIDVDILKRSGFKQTAELAALEKEIGRVLSNSTFNSQQKLSALTSLAESHGAHIDHQMLLFAQKLEAINTSGHDDHVKLIMLQEEMERQNKVRLATYATGHVNDDTFVSHVGGDTLRGSQVWETMVLRTMIYDHENGQVHGGGIKEELLSARLNVANRLGSLDPSSSMHELPEHMRNAGQLKAVTARNKHDLIELFTAEGREAFQRNQGKSITTASIGDIVGFMAGGELNRTGHVDKKTGRMVWWGADMELASPAHFTKVDTKRHWVKDLNPAENFAIGQWTESRMTKSYVPHFDAAQEAQLDRMSGSSGWTNEQRTNEKKKLMVASELSKDMEQRFNSQFGHNTYGTTRETTRFYNGVLSGFMEKALEEKGLSANHPDLRFIKEMDTTNPDHLAKLRDLMVTHKKEYEAVLSRPVSYDDIAKSNKAMVMLHEGGFAYYSKGMMLSDADRVMAGEVSLRDDKGQLRKFVPEDVPVNFAGRDDLMRQYQKVGGSKDPNEWKSFIGEATKWAKEGGYSYDKEKVLAAVLWSQAGATYNYSDYWKHSAVTVAPKREVTPIAPSPMRFFGAEGHTFTTMMKPFRDIGLHGGDYISKVALAAGGSLQKASYDITPTSEYYRQHSWQLSSKIMSGQDMKGLSEAEKVAYRNVATQHYAYHQVWDYAIDRNPWRTSTSFGTHQSWASFFHFGPASNFDVRDNLRGYMGKGEYANFMSLYGFPMNAAAKLMKPYAGMVRGMQMSMQGYASKWDQTPDALKQWNFTEPRLREAMQSINPFSAKWFSGKTSERVAKLNVFGGSLEQHQLAGNDYMGGLKQAPQDIFLQRKGVYASARTGETNPGASFMDYRANLHVDAPMAEYLIRNNEAAYKYDKQIQSEAMNNTTRRTVSAEALSLRRDQELRGFGAMQNPLYGWANPLAFLWHAPVPLFPQSLTPKDIIGNAVKKHKHGHGGSWEQSVANAGTGVARGTKRLLQPHLIARQVYCPKCGRGGLRGATCQCGQTLY